MLLRKRSSNDALRNEGSSSGLQVNNTELGLFFILVNAGLYVSEICNRREIRKRSMKLFRKYIAAEEC